jgi:hypothetical protein
MLMWVWHLFSRRRAHVALDVPDALPAPRDAAGEPSFPVNTPFCELHALVYPPTRVTCEVDGANLSVSCPVDGTVRPATDDICRACGTRFVLGASKTAALVRRTTQPPAGGAAVA